MVNKVRIKGRHDPSATTISTPQREVFTIIPGCLWITSLNDTVSSFQHKRSGRAIDQVRLKLRHLEKSRKNCTAPSPQLINTPASLQLLVLGAGTASLAKLSAGPEPPLLHSSYCSIRNGHYHLSFNVWLNHLKRRWRQQEPQPALPAQPLSSASGWYPPGTAQCASLQTLRQNPEQHWAFPRESTPLWCCARALGCIPRPREATYGRVHETQHAWIFSPGSGKQQCWDFAQQGWHLFNIP